MCGFTGFWTAKSPDYDMKSVASDMVSRIVSRGPDAQATWVDQEAGLALAHARLSIVDLSANGAQPMHSQCDRYIIVYNGEIYNTAELRNELSAEGIKFKGTSDTEVIINGIAVWGFEATIRRLIGMFAMAVWDKQSKCLYLARDRIGIKPLYWGRCNGTLFFGSQPKSFKPHPDFDAKVNVQAMHGYVNFAYVPAPLSIYQNINKLLPGHYVRISENTDAKMHCYWDIGQIAKSGMADDSICSQKAWLSETETLLVDAVKRRMIADVPLGAFLSGGIDSSLVVALMQSLSNKPVKTFSIGFTEASYNEANHAKAVAAHLKTDHHEVYLTPNQAQEIVPQLSEWYDEPFADSSQIPTYLVAKIAREHVTVSLSGDGGDELFAGYTRYFMGKQIWNKVKYIPHSIREVMACGIESLSPDVWDKLSNVIPNSIRPSHVGDKAHKFAKILNKHSAAEYYETLVKAWRTNPLSDNGNLAKMWSQANSLDSDKNFIEWMQLQDMLTYLPDDILTKVDRASMAVSLEARVPLLDHRLIEHSWRLPSRMKIQGGCGKWILRQILYKYVPKELIERPKMGFGVPVGDWICDEQALRPWAEELLSEVNLNKHGLFDVPVIRKTWQAHLAGNVKATTELWSVLMFQAWAQENL